MSEPIIETMTILPPLAATIVIVCLAISLAGLGIWLAAPVLDKLVHALEYLVRLIRRTLAARARIQHRQIQSDRLALDYWIRDAFQQNYRAIKAERRAAQERSLRYQVAETADAMLQRSGARVTD